MPREHNDKTMAKYEATVQSIEEEIKEAKRTFEAELLKTYFENDDRNASVRT